MINDLESNLSSHEEKKEWCKNVFI
jgi:hypothetical protein